MDFHHFYLVHLSSTEFAEFNRGLAHEVINISSGSDDSLTESERRVVDTLRAPTYTEGPSEKRQKGVRLPKIGFSAEEWLSPLGQDFIFEPTGPGLNAPLQIREPTEAEMSRRNIPRPSIPTKSANPARGRSTDQQQQHQKKQKLSEEAGQAALNAYDRAVKVTAERERYRTDRDNFRAKFKISETQLQETDAEVERLKKELVEAKAAAATAEADMERMRVEEKKKLDEADAKGYEAGIKRAALEYTQTAHQMVNDALEERLPEFFELGYAAGAEAMATVLVVETDTQFRQQVINSLNNWL
ncbi:hypothetical protein RHGRI_038961 [Rhododendron griersonianum]|uniref:Uncharacterized protein n=1 Tax=Rhododendron griersonianum TaxID=479676 RepID=A0AAV6HM29_9ERIC|nr:hypothetical protein RHGRI_038961 [Rhododendron griersonianum]